MCDRWPPRCLVAVQTLPAWRWSLWTMAALALVRRGWEVLSTAWKLWGSMLVADQFPKPPTARFTDTWSCNASSLLFLISRAGKCEISTCPRRFLVRWICASNARVNIQYTFLSLQTRLLTAEQLGLPRLHGQQACHFFADRAGNNFSSHKLQESSSWISFCFFGGFIYWHVGAHSQEEEHEPMERLGTCSWHLLIVEPLQNFQTFCRPSHSGGMNASASLVDEVRITLPTTPLMDKQIYIYIDR